MSERVDDNIDRLSKSLAVWEEVRRISDDIESWASSCALELSESLNNLNDSHKMSGRLAVVEVWPPSSIAEQSKSY